MTTADRWQPRRYSCRVPTVAAMEAWRRLFNAAFPEYEWEKRARLREATSEFTAQPSQRKRYRPRASS
jgi:hypothetical protein